LAAESLNTFVIHIFASVCSTRIKSYIIIYLLSCLLGEIQWKGENAMLFSLKERGQGLVEYALILVLVAIVVLAVLLILGPVIGNAFSTVNKSLNSI
jgi:pilus assembly protein Flp/PilA